MGNVQENQAAAQGRDLLWDMWAQLGEILLRQERAALAPYSETRLEDAEALIGDVQVSVRQAREAAERMRADFPGYNPA